MEHDGCKGCIYEDIENSDYCQGCKQNSIDKYIRKTNADVIRNMTNEELANFLSSICKLIDDETPMLSCFLGKHYNILDDDGDVKEWLESECDV